MRRSRRKPSLHAGFGRSLQTRRSRRKPSLHGKRGSEKKLVFGEFPSKLQPVLPRKCFKSFFFFYFIPPQPPQEGNQEPPRRQRSCDSLRATGEHGSSAFAAGACCSLASSISSDHPAGAPSSIASARRLQDRPPTQELTHPRPACSTRRRQGLLHPPSGAVTRRRRRGRAARRGAPRGAV
jgi:hypothetical protein